jgi:hypothetical protein
MPRLSRRFMSASAAAGSPRITTRPGSSGRVREKTTLPRPERIAAKSAVAGETSSRSSGSSPRATASHQGTTAS